MHTAKGRTTLGALVAFGLACACAPGFVSADSPSPGTPFVAETTYPTEDIVVASFDVKSYGAVGDGATDDSSAFRLALNAASREGGGVVFVPAGRYAIHGNLQIPAGVTLRGDWRHPDDQTTEGIGTLLQAYAGRGDEDGLAFITLHPSSGLKDLAIWYPEQNYDDIQPYPWTIKQASGNNMTVENVTLFNSYKGIRMGPEFNERHTIRNVYGTPLRIGIHRDRTSDVGRFQRISFRPKYWVESGLPGAPASEEAETVLRAWMATHGVGFVAQHADWLFVYDLTLENYGIGFVAEASPTAGTRGPNGGMQKLHIFGGRIGLQIKDTNPFGLTVVDSRIDASKGDAPVAVLATAAFRSAAQFNTVTFGAGVRMEGSGVLSFLNSTFEDWAADENGYAVDVQQGGLIVAQSAFEKPGPAIRLGPGTTVASIVGNSFAGTSPVANQAPDSADVRIEHDPINLARMATDGHPFRPTPRPDSTALYNAVDYGATPRSAEEDSKPIQAALDAAGETGGTVFLPAGIYRLEYPLRVPSGVELRGVFDVPHHTRDTQGTEFFAIAGKGEENGTPLITLEAGAGVRGLRVFYPEQTGSGPLVPFPWTIQGRGPNVWAKDIVLVGSYQGVDFGTYPSEGYYIQAVAGAPQRRGIFVGHNAGEGWIENVQFLQHYWHRGRYSNASDPQTMRLRAIQNLEGIILGYNEDIHALHTFVYGADKGLSLVEQDGLGAASGTIIGHGTDGSETGLFIDAVGEADFINAQLVAMISEDPRRNVVVTDHVDGRARFFGLMLWGQPDRALDLAGGQIELQQVSLSRNADIAISGGEVHMAGSYLQVPATEVVVGANAVVGSMETNIHGSDVGVRQSAALSEPASRDEPGTGPPPQGGAIAQPLPADASPADGPHEPMSIEGRSAARLIPRPNVAVRYLYFVVEDPVLSDGNTPVEIRIEYWADSEGELWIQYDSADTEFRNEGRFKPTGRQAFDGEPAWRSATLTLPDARFAGRQTHLNADFRITVVTEGEVAIGKVTVQRIEASE